MIFNKNKQKGFTLLEILIAMALLTVISIVMIGSLGPWLSFKQKLDTDRKLQDIKAALILAYGANAMTAESSAGPQLQLVTGTVSQTPINGSVCVTDVATWQALATYLPEGPTVTQVDGYSAPWCVLITPQLQATLNGVTVYYHNIALVSMGREGKLDSATTLNPTTGALTLGGDNTGILVNGYSVQADKLTITVARMDKLASPYGIYFTSRYLGNPNRDIMVDYFATSNPGGSWDTSGTGLVLGTQTGSEPASTILAPLGVSTLDGTSAYEVNNVIQVSNFSCEPITATCPQTSNNGGSPPYSALLFTALPGPQNILIKTITGNY